MISIKNLSITDSIFNNQLVKDLSLSINANHKIAIIGSEGTGKSTLLKLIDGQNLSYTHVSGEIISPYRSVYTEQNITYLWHSKTVYDFLIKSLNQHDPNHSRKLLYQFGFDYDQIINRQIHTFSGGEKVKLSLIKAMIQDPDILLLDEPSNDLDFETIQFLENLLKDLTIPIVFITHDQRLLENVANGIIHLQHIHKQKRAKTNIFFGTYDEYKSQYANHFDNSLRIAHKQRSDHKKKIKKFNEIYAKVEHKQNQAVRNPSVARLLKKKIKSLKSQEHRFSREKEQWTDIPEKEDPIHIFFDDQPRRNPQKTIVNILFNNYRIPDNSIIKNINLKLMGQDKVVIYGRNGIGKTTFIKDIVLYLKQNKIDYGYIPQNYMDILKANQTVIDFLIENQSKYPEYRLRQILSHLGFKFKEMNSQTSKLSEGLKLKVLLLLMVSKTTEVLILDEPTRNISPLNQDEIYSLFSKYDGAIIAITHDRSFIENVFTDIYELTKEGLILST